MLPTYQLIALLKNIIFNLDILYDYATFYIICKMLEVSFQNANSLFLFYIRYLFSY